MRCWDLSVGYLFNTDRLFPLPRPTGLLLFISMWTSLVWIDGSRFIILGCSKCICTWRRLISSRNSTLLQCTVGFFTLLPRKDMVRFPLGSAVERFTCAVVCSKPCVWLCRTSSLRCGAGRRCGLGAICLTRWINLTRRFINGWLWKRWKLRVMRED